MSLILHLSGLNQLRWSRFLDSGYLQILNIPSCFVIVLQEVLAAQTRDTCLIRQLMRSCEHELVKEPTFSRS